MSKLARSTIGLMIVTLISKILGFFREIVITYTYGATEISDVYITTLSIPTILFAVIGAALSTTAIPLFYEVNNKKGNKEAVKFSNNIFNIIMILSIVIAIIGCIFSEPLVKIFAMSFTGEKLDLAICFTRIMIFGVIFIALSNMMTIWLHINERFTIPGIAVFPYNLVLIASIILANKISIWMMPIGALIAILSQFIFQLPYVIKSGYKYKFYIDIKDEYIKKMFVLILPVLIGVSVNQINTVIDRSLSSTLGDGIITILNSASRLNGFVLGLFIVTISAVIYPTLSRLSNDDKNKEKFVESVIQSVNTVVLLIIPISVGAIVLSEPVVRIVFERGAFDSNDTNMTAIALSCYSIGMIGFGLREILNRVFYSLQDTKTPMVNGALAMGMNIVLNLIMIRFLGHAGLALATSISALICIVLLFNSLKKKIGYFGQDKIRRTMIKSLIAAIGMGVITILSYKLLANVLGLGFIQEAIALFGAIGVGAIVYAALVVVLKVEEVNIVINMVKSKLKI